MHSRTCPKCKHQCHAKWHSTAQKQYWYCEKCQLKKWQGTSATWADPQTLRARKKAHKLQRQLCASQNWTTNEFYEAARQLAGRPIHFGQMTAEQITPLLERLRVRFPSKERTTWN